MNEGPFPPPALTGFPGTMDLSDSPNGPACPSRASGWKACLPPLGLPVLRSFSYADMLSPLPRRDRRWDRVAPLESTTAAFPVRPLGRLPHYDFRGLFGVHSRYGLPARGTAKRSFPSKAPAISLPPPPLRLLLAGATLARWELHPLKNDAFARRTDAPCLTPSVRRKLFCCCRSRRDGRRRCVPDSTRHCRDE